MKKDTPIDFINVRGFAPGFPGVSLKMPGDIRENSSRLGCKREEFSFCSYVLMSENRIIIFPLPHS